MDSNLPDYLKLPPVRLQVRCNLEPAQLVSSVNEDQFSDVTLLTVHPVKQSWRSNSRSPQRSSKEGGSPWPFSSARCELRARQPYLGLVNEHSVVLGLLPKKALTESY